MTFCGRALLLFAGLSGDVTRFSIVVDVVVVLYFRCSCIFVLVEVVGVSLLWCCFSWSCSVVIVVIAASVSIEVVLSVNFIVLVRMLSLVRA